MLIALLVACAGPHIDAQRCACPDNAMGAQSCDRGACGPCMCLPLLPSDPDPEFGTTFEADPSSPLDWPAIDAALADGPVLVSFATGVYPDRLDVLRTDDGPHRLVLDGGGGDDRAEVPGIHTTYDGGPRHRVTVRGFDVTGSRDKGIYWRAGDGLVIEDNLIHDNKGTPALNFDYANRTGMPSTGITVRNNHVFNQIGECIYIGGVEGTDHESHAEVAVVGNMIHNCWDPFDAKHDGINIKDRIEGVEVSGNVVFDVSWGIEVASPGLIANNIVFDTKSNGFHFSDGWGTGLSGLELRDNVVLRSGERGARMGADRLGADGIVIDGLTIQGSKQAGVIWAGDQGVSASLDRVVLVGNDVGLDGWGTVDLDVGNCHVHANDADDDNAAAGTASDCTSGAVGFGDLSEPAGPDGTFFTADDPWLVEGGASLP